MAGVAVRGKVVPVLAAAWLAAVGVVAISLLLENATKRCPVPSNVAQRSGMVDGKVSWGWLPPGSACVKLVRHRYAPDAPSEWARPQAWRSAVVVLLVLSGAFLFLALWLDDEAFNSL